MTGAAKKSLFDILADRLTDAIVVDLYCGTGTLGLEAISRAARRCYLADCDRRVLARLRRNIEAMGASPACTVWSGDVPSRLARWLAGIDEPVDIAFVDPPFSQVRQQSWQRVSRKLFSALSNSLSDDGLVVLRLPSDASADQTFGPLQVHRVKKYGGMTVMLLAAAAKEQGGG